MTPIEKAAEEIAEYIEYILTAETPDKEGNKEVVEGVMQRVFEEDSNDR